MDEIPSTNEYTNPRVAVSPRRRVAYYGGSFDPVHRGHMAIALSLLDQFDLDLLIFVPAFHAPHKIRLKPTSAYDRYAMLCLATANQPAISVSRIEIEVPEHPYSVETLERINAERPDDAIFFAMGADSWMEIKTWREWKKVLTITNVIVITRPGVEIGFGHVTDDVRSRIVDLRGKDESEPVAVATGFISTTRAAHGTPHSIYFTDSVNLDISATEIRRKIRESDSSWRDHVPPEVAIYIEKYQIYN